MHPVEKTALDRKMEDTIFDGHDKLYHHAQFGKDLTMRAGCRCENVVFVFLSRSESGALCVRGVHIVRLSVALPFIARFRRGFQRFFF